jgi:hypothetical protein
MRDNSKYKYYLLDLVDSLLQIVSISCLLARVKWYLLYNSAIPHVYR